MLIDFLNATRRCLDILLEEFVQRHAATEANADVAAASTDSGTTVAGAPDAIYRDAVPGRDR